MQENFCHSIKCSAWKWTNDCADYVFNGRMDLYYWFWYAWGMAEEVEAETSGGWFTVNDRMEEAIIIGKKVVLKR